MGRSPERAGPPHPAHSHQRHRVSLPGRQEQGWAGVWDGGLARAGLPRGHGTGHAWQEVPVGMGGPHPSAVPSSWPPARLLLSNLLPPKPCTCSRRGSPSVPRRSPPVPPSPPPVPPVPPRPPRPPPSPQPGPSRSPVWSLPGPQPRPSPRSCHHGRSAGPSYLLHPQGVPSTFLPDLLTSWLRPHGAHCCPWLLIRLTSRLRAPGGTFPVFTWTVSLGPHERTERPRVTCRGPRVACQGPPVTCRGPRASPAFPGGGRQPITCWRWAGGRGDRPLGRTGSGAHRHLLPLVEPATGGGGAASGERQRGGGWCLGDGGCSGQNPEGTM